MNMHKVLSDFQLLFSDKKNNEMEDALLVFLRSFEYQRQQNIDLKSAFINSIKTPTKQLNWEKIQEIEKKNQQLKIELKKKRSKKYMLLFRYQSDVFALKKEGLSLEKIAKALIIKHSIPKNLQPNRQNIFNFLKENKRNDDT